MEEEIDTRKKGNLFQIGRETRDGKGERREEKGLKMREWKTSGGTVFANVKRNKS